VTIEVVQEQKNLYFFSVKKPREKIISRERIIAEKNARKMMKR
jgi:hypothetical protein